MEENQNKKNKKNVVDFSVVLSFVIAIFAVFSLVACGFDQISYAAPVTGNQLTFYKGEIDGNQVFVVSHNADSTKRFSVPLYYSDAEMKNAIFCIEHANENTVTGTVYNKGNVISDYGLLYLLNNSFVNDKTIVTGGNKYAEAWVTQVAIWVYLYEKYPGVAANAINAEELAAIQSATQIKVPTVVDDSADINFGTTNLYTTYVRPLVDAAKAASDLKKITVNKADDNIVKTSDGKFYQTSVISVVGNPSGDMTGYDIVLSGIDGVIAVDEAGKELTTTNVAPGTKFYVRIPADKVTDKAQTLEINVKGHFNTLTGNEYNAVGDFQKIVSVTGATTDVSGGTSIEVVGAPDTGMTTAQTIYFIGLIVLLCGVGIIYANAKPVENQQ